MTYSDMMKADIESKNRIMNDIFLDIVRFLQTGERNYDDIHSNLKYSSEYLNKVITESHKPFFQVRIREGKTKEDYKTKDIFIQVNKEGIDFYIRNT